MKPTSLSISKAFLLAGLVLLASCSKERITGSGSTTTEERNIGSAFRKISVSASANVHITKGDYFQVLVKGYSNLIPYIVTNLSNDNTLEIGLRTNVSIRNSNLEVYITMPLVEVLKNSGSANIDMKGRFDTDLLNAEVSGSGNIDIEGRYIKVLGATVSGSGSIRAFNAPTPEADVFLSGSGMVEVAAYVRLTAHISGSGNVYYKGTPVIESHLSGSGNLLHRD